MTDPDNREMSIGCGAALDHLLVGLTAAGYRVDRLGREGPTIGVSARNRIHQLEGARIGLMPLGGPYASQPAVGTSTGTCRGPTAQVVRDTAM